MPVIVREIGVKVNVRARADERPLRVSAPDKGLTRREREELTDTCVRRVLAELRRERER